MFRRIVEEWRGLRPKNMTEETREEYLGKYTEIYETYKRLVDYEEWRLDGLIRLRKRLWGRVRLAACQAALRTAWADVERFRPNS